MKRTLGHNLSANTFQLAVNQLFGLGIFYILSTGLDKHNFGQINLALAILLAAFNILSCGIDQLVIKKVAAGDNVHPVLSLYIYHVVFTGLAFYGMLAIGFFFFPHSDNLYSLLLLIGIGKLMIFLSTPFKQVTNGMEQFRLLARMSVISNFTRCCGLILLAVLHSLDLHDIVIVFIIGDVAELIFCLTLFYRFTKIPAKIKWNKAGYFKLLKEALPQTGVVLITSALARFDWIFIGFMVSAIKLAEYSFAYKVFEISTLPLLAIAPLLIPRFTKMVQSGTIPVDDLKFLIRVELIIAAFIGLLLNVCWAPVIDGITAGKYGMVNVNTIFILTLCMPLLYLNNFFWTIYFVQGRLKMILTSFIITFTVNVVGDITLIPVYKCEGAAFAFFVACLVQTVYYFKQNQIPELNGAWKPLVLCTACALLSGFIAKVFFDNDWIGLALSIVFFLVFLIVTIQIKIADGKRLKQLLG